MNAASRICWSMVLSDGEEDEEGSGNAATSICLSVSAGEMGGGVGVGGLGSIVIAGS